MVFAIRESRNIDVIWKIEDKSGNNLLIRCLYMSSNKSYVSSIGDALVTYLVYVTSQLFFEKCKENFLIYISTV